MSTEHSYITVTNSEILSISLDIFHANWRFTHIPLISLHITTWKHGLHAKNRLGQPWVCMVWWHCDEHMDISDISIDIQGIRKLFVRSLDKWSCSLQRWQYTLVNTHHFTQSFKWPFWMPLYPPIQFKKWGYSDSFAIFGFKACQWQIWLHIMSQNDFTLVVFKIHPMSHITPFILHPTPHYTLHNATIWHALLVTTLEIIDHIIGDGGNRVHGLSFHHKSGLRTCWLSLSFGRCLSSSLRFGLHFVVTSSPLQKLLSATRGDHMLHTNMETLFHYPSVHLATWLQAKS